MTVKIKARKVWCRIKFSLSSPFVWRDPRRRARVLAKFSAIEADSSWQLLQAYERFSDPHIKAELFCQAVEERHHSLLFRQLAQSLSAQSIDLPLMEKRAIVAEGREAWEWFAFCHAGESEALSRFRSLASALDGGPEKEVLVRILRDEALHVHSASEQADELGAGREAFIRAVRQAKRRRWRASWMRQGRLITGAFAQVLLALTYILLGPLGAIPARAAVRLKINESMERSDWKSARVGI